MSDDERFIVGPDLMAPPHSFSADPSVGDCVISFDRGDLIIDQADPRVLIAAEFYDFIRDGWQARWLGVTIEDRVLRIQAVNRTVVYRIGEKTPDGLAYYAEWPD